MQDRKEQSRAEVARLVERYQGFTTAQRRAYNEEETKKDFILPLFKALGWDVDQKEEVAAEVSASKGRVDYAFKLHGVPHLYVEAKGLGNDLTDPKWARQAITYAYHQGVTWAVLVSFSHLKVFNANIGATDAGARLLLNLPAGDLLGNFDRLWWLSKESVQGKTLEQEAETLGLLPHRTPVEKRLYGQLRDWRERLFNSIARYEHHLSPPEIDEVIQRLFNRLIFMRTCEDRGLETQELLSALHRYRDRQLPGNPPLLQELRRLFKYYDRYYDSDLFALHPVDTIHIDDPLLEEMLSGLHGVPGGLADYDFSLIDADILGAVYEQYLGHVAQEAIQRGKRAQQQLRLGLPGETTYEITSKRERRKEQGIYYTPLWVTDYIVRQTVGAFIEEHQKRPDAIYDLKILDLSCGSGSFLIRAYDRLLRWQADTTGIPLEQLTQEYRMPLLKNNIFGVDLDQQAIEIARLNLLLRALAERALLPSLADNVVRGNSLISGTPADLKGFFGDNWEEKRPFTWEQVFPKVMQEGGFDVVIGNPPYVRIQTQDRKEADYFRANYQSARGSFDLSVLFVEKGLGLLKPGGRLGFITSGKFLKSQYGDDLEVLIQENATVETIVDVSQQQVFADATTYPVVLVLQKTKRVANLTYRQLPAEAQVETLMAQDVEALPTISVPQDAIASGVWPPLAGTAKSLSEKMASCSTSLGNLSQNVFQGLITSADKVYHLKKVKESRIGVIQVHSEALQKDVEMESAVLKPLVSGKHVSRYAVAPVQTLLLFPYDVQDGKAQLIPASEFEARFPLVWEYLNQNRATLENRESGKMRHERWYAFGRTQSLGLHDYPKFTVPRLVHRLECAYDGEGKYYLDNVDVGGVLLKDNSRRNYLYVMGLLNSQLLDWQFQQISAPFRGGYRSANRQFLEPLPIRRIDFGNATDKALRDGLVALVERMLVLQERARPLRGTGLSEEQDVQREIERVDRQIDGVVYELYGLTEGERRLVEGENVTVSRSLL